MSERRFVIREIYKGEDPNSIDWVIESELKRRIEDIVDYVEKDDEDYQPCNLTAVGLTGAVNILLHGEKEQPDEWEEWASKIANDIYFRADFPALKSRFLSIPCNPRRKP